jgi:hypothetical protein
LGFGGENLIEQSPEEGFEDVELGARDRHALRPIVDDEPTALRPCRSALADVRSSAVRSGFAVLARSAWV